jgi:hypothetical protein
MKKILLQISHLFHWFLLIITILSFSIKLLNFFWLFFEYRTVMIAVIAYGTSIVILILTSFELTFKSIMANKNKDDEIKYRITFYPAIKNAPKFLIIGIYFVWLIIPLGYLLRGELGIALSITCFMDYFSSLTILSSVIGYKNARFINSSKNMKMVGE